MSEDPNHRSPTIGDLCREVCGGNVPALQFCDIWFNYCHEIDDLLDTMEDGRPSMGQEQILGIFGTALRLYNCPFYVAHQQHLFPVALMVTNAYADSVAWEKSPVRRRRAIADILRCVGNEMFFVVAMITGGWEHMRAMSPRIRELSFILQHDENDQPN